MKKLPLVMLSLLALCLTWTTPASAQEIDVKGTVRLKNQTIEEAVSVHDNGDAILKAHESLRKAWQALRNAQDDLAKKTPKQNQRFRGPARDTGKEDEKLKRLQEVVDKKSALYETAREAFLKEMGEGVTGTAKVGEDGKFLAKATRKQFITYSSSKEAKAGSRGFIWVERAAPFLEINESNKKEDFSTPPEVDAPKDTGSPGYPPQRGR